MIWAFLVFSLGMGITSGAVLGATLGLVGLLILYLFNDGATNLAVMSVVNLFTDFTLSAIPLFILLGEILLASGLSARLYQAVSPVFRRVPGGLLHSNIVVSTMFGAVNGSSMSTAAAVGSVAYPALSTQGYRKSDIVATVAAGGTLGLLIPPSLSLLIYGAITDTSIGRLFLAGVLPGLLFAAMFHCIIWLQSRAPDGALDLSRERESWLGVLQAWPVLVLILAIMGSIIGGFATPTEAAGIGVVASILIGAVVGDLRFAGLVNAIHRSVSTFAALGFVILGATILAQSISVLGLPRQLLEFVAATGYDKYVLLAVVVAIYLVLGCVFEGMSLMIMTLPIVFPLLTGLGFDPVWLGVVVTIMIEIALITPPVGLNLYVLTAITNGEVNIGEAARAAGPYWVAMLIGTLILTIFPGIALVLPNMIF
jgi:C4-dicarboxylate transporter DctM subunit